MKTRRGARQRGEINETWIIGVLRRIGPESLPVLLRFLKHENGAIRAHAVSAIGEIAPRDRKMLALLRSAKRDPDDYARSSARGALREFLTKHPDLVGE
jgi:HEAT repeat protein